jgi:hypothetical protein
MANPGQPTISLGAAGDAVKRLERALRRTPDLGLTVDGAFGPQLETAVKQFQHGAGLTVDWIVGLPTWAAHAGRGLSPTRPRLFRVACGDPIRWKQRSAYSSWPIDPKCQKGVKPACF